MEIEEKDYPGFRVTRLASGSYKIFLLPGQDSETVFVNLQNLRGRQEFTHIDLSKFPTERSDHHRQKQLAHHVLPLALEQHTVRITVPSKWVSPVQGCCKGIIVNAFREITGTQVKVLGRDVKIRHLIDSHTIVSKIKSIDNLDQFEATLQLLRDIQTMPYIPHSVSSHVVSAAKHVRRLWSRQEQLADLGAGVGSGNLDPDLPNPDSQSEQQTQTDTDPQPDTDTKTDTHCDTTVHTTHNAHTDTAPDTDPHTSTETRPESHRAPQTDKHTPINPAPTLQELPKQVLGYLGRRKVCYVCRANYSFPKKIAKIDESWRQYPKMCHGCASINLEKRTQKTDLLGRYAVVTGGRVKIGYHVVLKLLRDGCHVIATTRFPLDAATRFQQEPDYDAFSCRLKIYPMDLKNLNGVYRFIQYVETTFPHLDILINNAAQTIRRPKEYFHHMLNFEMTPISKLHESTKRILATGDKLNYGMAPPSPSVELNMGKVTSLPLSHHECSREETSINEDKPSSSHKRTYQTSEDSCAPKKSKLGHSDEEPTTPDQNTITPPSDTTRASSKPAMRLNVNLPAAATISPSSPCSSHYDSNPLILSTHFPPGQLDVDGQQLDLRPVNSWMLDLEKVPLGELLEVLAINTVAPFVLTQHLKGWLDKSPHSRKFIVNVSAMEGQFNRTHKTQFHPHTNMGKAALNMMTCTAARGYKNTGVYMTAVDTGWVTDERPYHQAKHEEDKGFMLPLDIIDGAARVYDPIVSGINNTEQPQYGVFLKNYKSYPW